MKFNDETKPLYLETDACGMKLGPGLLQSRSSTSYSKDKAAENSILRPITFVSKGLSSTEKKIQQHRKRSTRYTMWTQKVPQLLLCRRGTYNHRSQTPSSNLQKRCTKTITETITHSAQYRVRIIYKSGPDIFVADWLSRPNHKENRCRNTWHAIKYWCRTNNYIHPRLHDNIGTTTGTVTGWTPTTAQRTYHQRLAREQRSNTLRHENILDILRWHGSDWLGYT